MQMYIYTVCVREREKVNNQSVSLYSFAQYSKLQSEERIA